jgi:hypothetical protein
MKTLRNWANKNNVVVAKHAHARCVGMSAPKQSSLYDLIDYRVSSIACGTIWLIRREPFSQNEMMIRGNIRNACVGQSLLQLYSMLQDSSDFRRDCIEEYIHEMECVERDNQV